VLKLSRTIADLAGESEIATQHLAEALQYRPKTNLM
jgi:magnesium chelatase family protein